MTTPQVGDHYYERKYSPPVSPRSQPHGLKRRATDDEVESQAHISNHFKKLKLHNAKRPSPMEVPPVGVSLRRASSKGDSPTMSPTTLPSPMFPISPRKKDDDYMPIDDTADRVFIQDLDAEIAEIEKDEARDRAQLFLPEFDKEVSRVPQHLLRQQTHADDPKSNMQMILYQDPSSISVPEEEDAVRKAIIAARRRMRERQKEEKDEEDIGMPYDHSPFQQERDTGFHGDQHDQIDPDAMDIG